MLPQDLAGVAVFLFNDRKQQMLSRDKLVLHLIGLLLRSCKDLTQARTKVLLTSLYARKASYCGLSVVKNNGNVGSELSKDRSDNTLRLLEHRDEQMFRLNLLVLISLRQLDGGLNCFLSS